MSARPTRRAFLALLGMTAVVTLAEPPALFTPPVGGWPYCIARAGDVITVSGYKAVNPLTYEVLECDREFVVTRDVWSTHTEPIPLSLWPDVPVVPAQWKPIVITK